MMNSDSTKTGTAVLHSDTSTIIAPMITFVIGAILSISVFSLVRGWEESELQSLFEFSARNRLAALQTDIIRHQSVVNSMASLFSSSHDVSRKEFSSFVQSALSSQTSILALGWNPLIKNAERNKYIEQAQKDGFTDFKITEFDPDSHVVEAMSGNDAVVVYYIEPYAGNEKALGFNIASHPGRLQAILQARDSGKAVITERIELVQNQDISYLLFMAVYQKSKAINTVAERREHFVGLAAGAFRLNNWMPFAMRSLPPMGLDVLILDQSAAKDNQFLHLHSSRTRDEVFQPTAQDIKNAETGLHWKTTINVLGREWSFLFMPAPVFMETHRSWQAWTILIAGFSFTLLLTLYLFAKARHTARMASANIELLHENTERKINVSELRDQIDFIDTVLDAASNIIVVIDLEGRFVRFNRAAEAFTGYSIDEVLNKPVWDLVIPEEQRNGVRTVFDRLRKGKVDIASQYEKEWLHRDGSRCLFQWHNSVLHDENGNISHIVAMGYDITEKKKAGIEHERLQRELQQAHKMESLGQLTGGIAHDFNNLLGIINGYATLIHDKYRKKDEKLTNYVANILEAGDRAARLVSQMLAFSRSEQVDDKPVQFESLLKEDLKMLHAILPSTIDIKTEIEPDLPSVLMNPIHLHQILMNLAINARDAMQEVGQLTIKLGWARGLNAESQISYKPVKGDWIELSVSDTGSGIEPDTTRNIFNPFFTTKDVGKGTGMGLSVIYGIMQSHEGHILLESEPGKGSTFRMLFSPVIEETNKFTQDNLTTNVLPKGDGSEILVVDDELSLCTFMTELLLSNGYQAHFETESTKALALFQHEPNRFSMLITDQTMPRMTGMELINNIRMINPDLPVILCTGNNDMIDKKWVDELAVSFFEKPASNKRLLLKIAALLKVKNQ